MSGSTPMIIEYLTRESEMSGIGDDFDLGFEEPTNDHVPNTEILPQAPTIGGKTNFTNIHGSKATSVGGRMTSPPLFAQASLFPTCTQLRCWKIENGIPTGIGTIHATANEEEFVKKFSSAMPQQGDGSCTFKLRPLDIDGRELGQEFTQVISEHHAAIKKKGARSESPEVNLISEQAAQMQTMQSMIEMLRTTLEASQKSLEEERKRTQELMAQMAQERIDLASNAASGVQIISERMMDADAKRHEAMLRQEQERNRQSSDNMAAFFQSQSEMLSNDRARQVEESERQRERDKDFSSMLVQMEQQRREREISEARERLLMAKEEQKATLKREQSHFQMMLEQERLRRERDQQEFTRQRQREQDEWDRKEQLRREEQREQEKRRERDMREREAARSREHEMRLKEMEMSAQRDREHAERMMQLQAIQVQNDKKTSFTEMVKDGIETLNGFGIDATDLISRMLDKPESGAQSEGVLNALTEVAGKVAEVVKENVKAGATIQAAQAQVQAAQAHAQTASPQGNMLPIRNMDQEMAMQHQRQMAMQQEMGMQQEVPPPTEEYINQQMAALLQEQEAEQAEPQIDLPLQTQKLARKALRNLAKSVKRSPSDQWERIITEGIVSEPSIYHYCNAVSVAYALNEAGLEPKKSQAIIDMLQQSPLVPNDLNYGE